MKRDYYTILGLSHSATLSDIKKAYRQKAKNLHPDIYRAENANALFIKINEAYEILSDHKKKYVYDLYFYTSTPKVHHPAGFEKREQQYNNWVKDAQNRANYHSNMEYSSFLQTPFYKAATKISDAIALLVVIGGVTICLFPVFRYLAVQQHNALFALSYCVPVGLALIASGITTIRS